MSEMMDRWRILKISCLRFIQGTTSKKTGHRMLNFNRKKIMLCSEKVTINDKFSVFKDGNSA